MSTYGPDLENEALAIIESDFIESCCTVATCVLVLYDYSTTFSREVELIWGRKRTSVTVLFHLNRCTVFVWAVLQAASFLSLATLPSCIGFNDLLNVVAIFLYAIWAAFSTVRTYAISEGHWWPTLIVCLLNIVPVVTNAYYNFANTWYQIDGIGGADCLGGSNLSIDEVLRLIIATRVCAIAADATILLITWRKTYGIVRNAHRTDVQTPLAELLLKDGTLYTVLLLFLNILNIVGYSTNVFIYAGGLFSTPLSSIIISHFLINLRQITNESQGHDIQSSRLSFVRPQRSGSRLGSFVDNMGEELSHSFASPDLCTD